MRSRVFLKVVLSWKKTAGSRNSHWIIIRTCLLYTSFHDLLYYFPYKYVDRSRIYYIQEIDGTMPYICLLYTSSANRCRYPECTVLCGTVPGRTAECRHTSPPRTHGLGPVSYTHLMLLLLIISAYMRFIITAEFIWIWM